MLKHHHRFFRIFFQVSDLFIVAAMWLLSYYLRFHLLDHYFPVTKGIPPFQPYSLLTLGVVIVWFVCFQLSGVYKSRRTQNVGPELLAILQASVVGFLLLVAGAYFTTGDFFSRGVLLFFVALSTFALFMERIIIRQVLKAARRRGYNIRRTVIIGDNAVGEGFLERMRFHPELGLQLQGVLKVGGARDASEGAVSRAGVNVLGDVNSLAEVLQKYSVDQIVLALRNTDQVVLDNIIATALDFNIDIRIVPDLHQFITLGCEVEEFEGLPLITLNQSPIIGWDSVAKRISDVVYASFALVVFSPLMLVIAALIKILSPGPVFYKQERMGLDGHVFYILKFRSMRVDAEKSTGAVWAQKDDGRVTWLGKILRKTSLDELPQFINVLRGDMSCVGPRPERPELVHKFKKDIPRYMLRHKVKAGITGWAQINGWRGNTSLEKRIEYDLYYITNWSLLFDFKIMVLTLFKGFVSKNAY